MRNAYRVIAYLIAAEVVIQGMAIAYALAGMGHWVDKDGGVVNKALIEDDSASFPGVGGFATHGINGTMIIPLLALILLVVAFFAKVPSGVKRALIILGLIVLQALLGIFSHEIPYVVMLHVINAFVIFMTALRTGQLAGAATEAPAAPSSAATA